MKTYKIWVEVEMHDDETDEYSNLDQMNAGIPTSMTEEGALEFAQRLHDVGEEMLRCFDHGREVGNVEGRRVRNMNRAPNDTPS